MTYRIIVVAIAVFFLASNAYAGNRTHVTETQGAGNSQASISFDFTSLDMSGSLDFAGGGKAALAGRGSGKGLTLGYKLGVADRFDIGISIPVSRTLTVDNDFFQVRMRLRHKVSMKVLGMFPPCSRLTP